MQPKEKVELYEKAGIGGIVRMNQDGSEKEVYSIGHRNPVGMDFHPTTGELWTNDNQVDGLGDDTPPGELNRITGPGQHFGFPYLNGSVRIPDYKDMEPPAESRGAVVETAPHTADLGLLFYTGNKFPAKYKKGVFTAQHGWWNRALRSARACCSRRSTMTAPRRASRKSSPSAGSTPTANISAGRSTSRNCATARSWSPTTSPARSIASRTPSNLLRAAVHAAARSSVELNQ